MAALSSPLKPLEAPVSVPMSYLPLVDLLELLAAGECRFDPELHTGPDVFETEPVMDRMARTDAAKAICETCPVWAACLEHALRTRPQHGIHAGYTPREIAALADAFRATGPIAEVA